jgi:polar amino acid transport system ATP-binding protein
MSRPIESASPVLSIRGLSLSFGQREVLRSVDLDVRQGQVVILLGASGSGKTSLLRCVNLLNQPRSGRIEIDREAIFDTAPGGKDRLRLSQTELNRIRAKTGMVFQQFNLFPHMTVLENVMEAPMLVGRVARATAEATARRLLEQMGLSDHVTKKPAQISGGQQQRVGIARALAMSPMLMLFDEPTSALDPELVGEVLKAMVALAKSGMTMLVVTHELGFAFEIADRVIFLDAGEIVADGAPSDILLNPTHPRLQTFVSRFHESADMLKPFLAALSAPPFTASRSTSDVA